MKSKMIFVHALSPLHAGTGQGVGVIDLPIAREVATGMPFLPGSSLKGVLRDRCADKAIRKVVFGPESKTITDSNAHAGAAQFSDQRLLLLPVRSLAGTFAWVTSPFVLRRLQRECKQTGDNSAPQKVNAAKPLAKDEALVTTKKILAVPTGSDNTAVSIILEDLDLTPRINSVAKQWAAWLQTHLFPNDATWQQMLEQRLCIVHDDLFGFLLETATEVMARNQLTEDKTSNNLWYEEALPAETFLSGIILAQQVGNNGRSPHQVLTDVQQLTTDMIQLGGNATIGRGLCRLIMSENGGNNGNVTAKTS